MVKTVLVVDDEPKIVEVVREYLLDQLTSDDLNALAEIMAKVKTRLES